jgi:HAD superfamily hydrolase (TIGR01549 family)
MAIQAVFFDFYNTLAGFDPPREVVQSRAAAEFGLRLTKEGVDAGYLAADEFMAKQNAVGRPVRSMTRPERDAFFARFEQLVLKGAGHDVDLVTADRVWRRVRAQEYTLALFSDVLPGLDALKRLGYTLGVITNLDSVGSRVMADFRLTGHADFAVTSRDAGAEKPHMQIFLAALDRAGASAPEAAHVGDQLDADIGGALAAGIQPILMDRFNGHRGYTAHPRVEKMADLPEALKAL